MTKTKWAAIDVDGETQFVKVTKCPPRSARGVGRNPWTKQWENGWGKRAGVDMSQRGEIHVTRPHGGLKKGNI